MATMKKVVTKELLSVEIGIDVNPDDGIYVFSEAHANGGEDEAWIDCTLRGLISALVANYGSTVKVRCDIAAELRKIADSIDVQSALRDAIEGNL